MSANQLIKLASLPRARVWPNSDVIRWERERIVAAGGDPTSVPDEPFSFLRMRDLERRIGHGRSTIYRWIDTGFFPSGINLSAGIQQK